MQKDYPNWNTGQTSGEKLLNGKLLNRPSYGNVKATARYCKTCQKVVWFEHENQAAARLEEFSPSPCPHCNEPFGRRERLVAGWHRTPMFK